MVNTISEYFSDEDLEENIRLELEEMWDTDLKVFFNQIEDMGDYFQLKFRGKTFKIDKITGSILNGTIDDEVGE